MRLVSGLAAAIVEKGYALVTIADIVRHARVSKRTFYEHFADKEACFLAGYAAVSKETLAILTSAATGEGLPWEARVLAAARAYLEALESQPELTRTYLLEIHAAGPRAIELRRAVHQQFAEALRMLVDVARKELPNLRPLSPEMATALVGGVNELVLVAIEGKRTTRLAHLAETAVDLFTSVVTRPATPEGVLPSPFPREARRKKPSKAGARRTA